MYKIITIQNGTIQEGTLIQKFNDIPSIVIGEEGRGRSLGVIPVKGSEPGKMLTAASARKTSMGLLLEADDSLINDDIVIVVCRTTFGFRGGNTHTGDLIGFNDREAQFAPCPLETISSGIVAEGIAGNMSSGTQYVGFLKKGNVLRIALTGRTYGKPYTWYYIWDGDKMQCMTVQQRKIADVYGNSPFPPYFSQNKEVVEGTYIPFLLKGDTVSPITSNKQLLVYGDTEKQIGVDLREYDDDPCSITIEHGMAVMKSELDTEPSGELVLVHEYSPGSGAKRYPSFYINWEKCPNVRVLIEHGRSKGSGADYWSLVIAPLGWSKAIAEQFVDARDVSMPSLFA